MRKLSSINDGKTDRTPDEVVKNIKDYPNIESVIIKNGTHISENIKIILAGSQVGSIQHQEKSALIEHVKKEHNAIDSFNKIICPIAGFDGRQPDPLMESLPIYGNWCGPGHSGPDDPIDGVDTVCMHHDQCYENRGMYICKCDRNVLGSILGASAKSSEGEVKRVAIYEYFQRAPCKCKIKICFTTCEETSCSRDGCTNTTWSKGGVCGD